MYSVCASVCVRVCVCVCWHVHGYYAYVNVTVCAEEAKKKQVNN